MAARRSRYVRCFRPLAVLIGAPSFASPAFAHGFGQRFDLPLPLWLWLIGAGASIVLSFVVMALFVRERRLAPAAWTVELMRFAPIRWLVHPVLVEILRAVAVLLFLLSVAAGLFGVQDPYSNLIATMVWVIWWVGLAFVCALVGNVWHLLNPLRTLFRWGEFAYQRLAGGRPLARALPYPPGLAVWPGVVLFFLFAWCELVWGGRDEPADLAKAMIAYSLITWLGMFLWGRETWLRNGEALSIAFGVLARFAPLDGEGSGGRNGARSLRLRPFGAGLLTEEPVHVSYLMFVLLMLSTVTFDGFLETPLYRSTANTLYTSPSLAYWLFRLSEFGMSESQVIMTGMLVLFPLFFLLAFLVTSWAMVRITGSSRGTLPVACSFVLTLVPIAVAYHLSHYFSFLVTTGQFIIPLASDPFGFGWDLFGTAGYRVSIGLLSPYVYWYSAVIIIIIGHVVAVFLAHFAALDVFGSRRDALLSQVPMLTLMVLYTMLSLWILAQPIVE